MAYKMLDERDILQETGDAKDKVLSQRAASTAFANALRGKASGSGMITLTDASPQPHDIQVRGVSENAVRVCSKNILPFPYASRTQWASGLWVTVNSDGSVTVDGTCTSTLNIEFVWPFTFFLNKGIYHVSLRHKNKNGESENVPAFGSSLYYLVSGGDKRNKENITEPYVESGTGNRILKIDEDMTMVPNLCIQILKNAEFVNETFWPQLEVGSAMTDWEPNGDNKEYTLNGQGESVDAISVPSSNMTLISESSDDDLTVTYNRDINRVIARLEQALIQNTEEGT